MISRYLTRASSKGLALFVLIWCLSCAGCAHRRQPAPSNDAVSKSSALAGALTQLSSTVSPEEAARLAEVAIQTSAELRADYDVQPPAWLHNVFVNMGLRSRGLCFHWSEDLLARLNREHFRTLEIHRVVARKKTWREHNALAVVSRESKIGLGLILDAWRNCGQLYWAPASSDRYPWRKSE